MKNIAHIATGKSVSDACPNCGYRLDNVTAVRFTDSERSAGPLPQLEGSPTLCCYCGALLIFADNQGHVRVMTQAERNSVEYEPMVAKLLGYFRASARGVGDFTKRSVN